MVIFIEHNAIEMIKNFNDREEVMRLIMYYDGKDYTKKILSLIKDRAKAVESKVHIVSCIYSWGEPSVRILREMRDDLNYLKDVLSEVNIPCYTHVYMKWRNPGEYILEIAYRYNVDEIIIGTNKESRVAMYRHGWFINHVINWAKCPVLIV